MKFCFTVMLVLAISCSEKEPMAKNVDRVKHLFASFNDHAWETMANDYAENASFLDPSFGREYVYKTRQETIIKYTEFQKVFPDMHDELTGVYASGDKVIVEFVSTGTSADGISFRLPIVSILTLKEDLVVTDATYYDQSNP